MIEKRIVAAAVSGIRELYGKELDPKQVPVQKTRPEFEGDYTVVTFGMTRFSGSDPQITANELGDWMTRNLPEADSFNVVKGFLNISIRSEYWLDFFRDSYTSANYGISEQADGPPAVIEYSSPNTNKPLHLGHVRNNLLGHSIARIMEATGKKVIRVNLVNDRGVHISKTMVAWQKWAEGKTPEDAGMKGDKFVGSLYVRFESENRKIMEDLKRGGMSEEEAYRRSPLMEEANEMLRKWEEGDGEVRALWEMMNQWVYDGFDVTYRRLGVAFDKTYHESETYLLGKKLVAEGLEQGVFFRKEDGSVWVDLSDRELDEKLLLRKDGTSVYMTQDLGTAELRFDDFFPDALLYVVGNEQNYHFEVLKIILDKLGRKWASDIMHISYGMVELPEGKMKSREGTVVDADDLMDEMHSTAADMTRELGKSEGLSEKEAFDLYEMIGMGALKYFILKVDPKKNMMFNPRESIDFNGNTGPFIQYTHARIRSLLRKGEERGHLPGIVAELSILPKEKQLIKLIHRFPAVVEEAASELSPANIANYIYELAREFNQFYQETPVLRADSVDQIRLRLALADMTARVIHAGTELLGFGVPDRM